MVIFRQQTGWGDEAVVHALLEQITLARAQKLRDLRERQMFLVGARLELDPGNRAIGGGDLKSPHGTEVLAQADVLRGAGRLEAADLLTLALRWHRQGFTPGWDAVVIRGSAMGGVTVAALL